MNNFFRKDLKLNEKWWHRLLKIIFYCILIVIIFSWGGYKPDGELYHKESDLGERLKEIEANNSEDFLPLNSLVHVLEDIGTNSDCDGSYWRLNRTDKYEEKLLNTYCSSNRTNAKLNKLEKETGYPFYDNRKQENQQYIRDYLNDYSNDQRQLRKYLDTKNIYSDTNTVLNFLNTNNIKCITTDNIVNTDFYYLEYSRFSLKDWDICFMRKNGSSWRLDFFIKCWVWLFYASILWIVWIVLYYKIFIYIVYWKKKKK